MTLILFLLDLVKNRLKHLESSLLKIRILNRFLPACCFVEEVNINILNKFLPGLLFHWRGRHLMHTASFYMACCFIGEVGIQHTQQVSTQLVVLLER